MSSNKRDGQYGGPGINIDISFFDILKKRKLRIEESHLDFVIIELGLPIVFPTIPFRN